MDKICGVNVNFACVSQISVILYVCKSESDNQLFNIYIHIHMYVHTYIHTNILMYVFMCV